MLRPVDGRIDPRTHLFQQERKRRGRRRPFDTSPRTFSWISPSAFLLIHGEASWITVSHVPGPERPKQEAADPPLSRFPVGVVLIEGLQIEAGLKGDLFVHADRPGCAAGIGGSRMIT